MTDLPITHRSFVNAWQCDENAHLNVQFYSGFVDQASPQLHMMLGEDLEENILPVEDHIRYHREMLLADAVEVASAPVSVTNDGLVAYHEIRNGHTGELAATVQRTTRTLSVAGESRSWRPRFLVQARRSCVELPEAARPRTAGSRGAVPRLAMNAPRAAKLIEIGRGQVQPEECGVEGVMSCRAVAGRISDGAGFLWQGLGLTRAVMRERRQGSAVLELLCRYHEMPAVGDLFVLRSGIIGVSDRILHIVHFLFDAETGKLKVQAEGAGALLDLEARKVVRLSDEEQRRLAASCLAL